LFGSWIYNYLCIQCLSRPRILTRFHFYPDSSRVTLKKRRTNFFFFIYIRSQYQYNTFSIKLRIMVFNTTFNNISNWSEALARRKEYLKEQIQKLINKQGQLLQGVKISFFRPYVTSKVSVFVPLDILFVLPMLQTTDLSIMSNLLPGKYRVLSASFCSENRYIQQI
jgi:hypothetical protein